MNHDRLEKLVQLVWSLLHDFYQRQNALDPLDYIVITDNNEPRLLIDDTSESDVAFVAVEFPLLVKDKLGKSTLIDPQELSVVCEEMSHFFHFYYAAAYEHGISAFELETRAEIDRFICFMHWNDFFPEQKMKREHENCRELCDTLFEHRHFKHANHILYTNAESLAFHHIKRAFAHCWTNRWINTSRFDPLARSYFIEQFSTRRWVA